METAKQNTQQNIEENDALKQFMGLLNRQGMGEQSQDFMELFQYVAGMQLQLGRIGGRMVSLPVPVKPPYLV